MSPLLFLLVLLLLGAPLVFSLRRWNELFVIDVREGKARFIRGKIPPRLLDDIVDVVSRSALTAGQIRVVKEDGRPRVTARGNFEASQIQQLRNVVGTYPLARILAGAPPADSR